MNIRRAGRKVVKNLHKEYGIYRIGFVNIYGEEDETELDAMNINDLERLWLSLCPEFECKGNSVCYVERVKEHPMQFGEKVSCKGHSLMLR